MDESVDEEEEVDSEAMGARGTWEGAAARDWPGATLGVTALPPCADLFQVVAPLSEHGAPHALPRVEEPVVELLEREPSLFGQLDLLLRRQWKRRVDGSASA